VGPVTQGGLEGEGRVTGPTVLHGGQVVVVVIRIKDFSVLREGPCERTGVTGRQLGALETDGRSLTAAGRSRGRYSTWFLMNHTECERRA
jgi:hypothetical protein